MPFVTNQEREINNFLVVPSTRYFCSRWRKPTEQKTNEKADLSATLYPFQ